MSIKLFRNKANAFESNIFRFKTNLENFWDLELQSYQYEPIGLIYYENEMLIFLNRKEWNLKIQKVVAQQINSFPPSRYYSK